MHFAEGSSKPGSCWRTWFLKIALSGKSVGTRACVCVCVCAFECVLLSVFAPRLL